MGSILTNNSANVALETLRMVNRGLETVQGQVATGKKIASSKDNAAFWAISQVMQSDVSAFKGISETLSLGQSTLAVARSGAETVVNLLNEMKGRIVASQEQNVDRVKIQADVAELVNQINATVGASQFNGLNLLQNVDDNDTVEILGALNRSTTGVTTSAINVDREVLEATGFAAALTGTTGVGPSGGSASATIERNPPAATDGNIATVQITGTDLKVGNTVAVKFGNISASFAITQEVVDAANEAALASTATPPSTKEEELAIAVATGLKNSLQSVVDKFGLDSEYTIAAGATNNIFTISNLTTNSVDFSAEAGGSQVALNMIDVSTEEGALSGLNVIENMVQGAINSSAAFGSSGRRLEIQQEFVKKLSDALTSGIGAIVDADMEAASARLQALQVQQQLGTQALSIANQQPQSILSLFR